MFGIFAVLSIIEAHRPSRAEDAHETHAAVQLHVGETKTLATFGGHKSDCVTSVRANRVEVSGTPRLGIIIQRENAPYTNRTSLSGTCMGAHFVGTAIDYTARLVGSETVVITASFDNGQVRRIVSVTVDP